MQQLDIFADSRDRILLNDLATMVEGGATDAAEQAADALRAEFPEHAQLAAAATLIDALRAETASWQPDVGLLRTRRLQIEQQLRPAAVALLGREAAPAWLAARWRQLAIAARPLDYDAAAADLHAAALWIEAGAWHEAIAAVQRIASWRRIPTPLGWMLQSRWRLGEDDASWALLAELAWLAPRRLATLLADAPPLIARLYRAFDAQFDGTGTPDDLTWFPAWLLCEVPALAPHLALAQACAQGPGERGMRLLIELLGLERQGRHADVVQHRRALRDLSAALYAAYIARR
jgi:hypothetical protein